MSMTALLFGFAMIDNLLLLFINVYNVSLIFRKKKLYHSIYCVQIITLSDLETDLINVRQCCEKLNQVCIDSLAFPRDKNSISRHLYQKLQYMLC